ncbi:kinase-like domain-containing protein [Globomyces pollinis-pini]|nr:kinase-like domain-containing protein [Globomyces pollinis-pini]
MLEVNTNRNHLDTLISQHSNTLNDKEDGELQETPTENITFKLNSTESKLDNFESPITLTNSTFISPIQMKRCDSLLNWKIGRRLGEGTYGAVHLGQKILKSDGNDKTELGPQMALKKFVPFKDKPQDFSIVALREIKILKKLKNENVVKLVDIVVEKGDYKKKIPKATWLVFPYLDHDLNGLIGNPQVTLTPPVIKSYMQQLLFGMEHLHGLDIIHRDIKTANILVSMGGVVKIADFGLARDYIEGKKMTALVITLWYRPPELLLLSSEDKVAVYTKAVDMWGIGCVFGEILLRRPLLPYSVPLDQIKAIFDLLGYPSHRVWPDHKELHLFKTNQISIPRNAKATLTELFPSKDFRSETYRFLKNLLQLDPKLRLTATEALDDSYFKKGHPIAVPNTESFPTFPTSHEMNFKRGKNDKPVYLRPHTDADVPIPGGSDDDKRSVTSNSNKRSSDHFDTPKSEKLPRYSSNQYTRDNRDGRGNSNKSYTNNRYDRNNSSRRNDRNSNSNWNNRNSYNNRDSHGYTKTSKPNTPVGKAENDSSSQSVHRDSKRETFSKPQSTPVLDKEKSSARSSDIKPMDVEESSDTIDKTKNDKEDIPQVFSSKDTVESPISTSPIDRGKRNPSKSEQNDRRISLTSNDDRSKQSQGRHRNGDYSSRSRRHSSGKDDAKSQRDKPTGRNRSNSKSRSPRSRRNRSRSKSPSRGERRRDVTSDRPGRDRSNDRHTKRDRTHDGNDNHQERNSKDTNGEDTDRLSRKNDNHSKRSSDRDR